PEREAADAGRGDQTARRGQAVGLRLAVDVRPGGAAADVRAARLRVDAHVRYVAEVDDDSAVARGEARDAVTSPADGDVEVVAPGEAHGSDPARRACAPDDHGRSLAVVHPVPDCTRIGVAIVVGRDHVPANALT